MPKSPSGGSNPALHAAAGRKNASLEKLAEVSPACGGKNSVVKCSVCREAIFHGSANFAIVFRGVSGSSVSVSSAESQLACSPLERKRLPGKRNSNSANGRVPLFFS